MLRGTVEEYYCSEFQVIPIKRFLSRALTYKHTNIHPKSKQYPRRVHYVLGVDNKISVITANTLQQTHSRDSLEKSRGQ